tara:strand:- start:541 stop:1467 length:927 start_codon:yes stop_codon:yes gene_type:complete
MKKNILIKTTILLSLCFTVALGQEQTDAIEKARQAKEAAEKAAAEAAAATEAAIEAAAAKAAKEARVEAKRKKEEEEARKLAEQQAAEEAELDAAASAAAEEAKRKMAEELGLEYVPPGENISESASEAEETTTDVVDETTIGEENDEVEDVVATESLGWNVGAAVSIGLLAGETFSNIPTGGTVVITTPFGFKVGPFDYTISLGIGGYTGNQEVAGVKNEFNPSFVGLGGNLTVADFIFAEGHIGTVGDGPGFRGFAGVTLERLMKKGLDLPFNVLVGSELFYGTEAAGENNSTGWAGFGARLDFGF